MELSLKIDPVAKLRVLKLSGDVVAQDLFDAVDVVYGHPDFDYGHNSLWDLSECRLENVSSETVKQFAGFIAGKRSEGNAPPRSAVVVTRDLEFGLVRMYETHLDADRDFRLFRDIDEAMAWLSSL